MGIVAAIARVRAGVKSAGLEGGLSSLGAELKSDAIPPRLRDVAGRLAALLGNASSPSSNTSPSSGRSASAPTAIPSLEGALEAHAALRASAAPGAVCPFTGLSAEEMTAQAERSLDKASSASALEAEQGAAAPTAPTDRAEAPPSKLVTELANKIEQNDADGATAAEVEVEARAPVRSGIEERAPVRAGGQGPAKRRAPSASRSGHRSNEKSKERLAESSSVANTSGRSATRPAAKRPRGGAESTRKKR